MTSTQSDASRVHVILPAARPWAWHGALIERLRTRYSVTVGMAHPSARPLPLLLRATLALQTRLFRDVPPLVGTCLPTATAPCPVGAVVIDLSETEGVARPGTPVLRPLYDGSPNTLALVGRLLSGECPLLSVENDAGATLVGSFAAIEDHQVLLRGMTRAFVRVAVLIERALATPDGQASPLPDAPDRPKAEYSPARLTTRFARLILAKVSSRFRRHTLRPDNWNVAVRWHVGAPAVDAFDLRSFTPCPVDPSTFYADPFVLEDGARSFLFAEAYPYARAKGVIACAEIRRGEASGAFRTVLDEPHHLSYPFVFRAGDDVFLMPEASESLGLNIYRATRLPDEWTLDTRLFEGQRLQDATLLQHDDRWWLFATVAVEGGSSWDELYVWHAPSFRGPWQPHVANPVKSDCRSARPAGPLLAIDGKLIRPAQRCERSYGEAVVWNEIVVLTPDTFVERAVAEWRPVQAGVTGLHAADLSTQLHAIDLRMPIIVRKS